jgi:hypothetical protein
VPQGREGNSDLGGGRAVVEEPRERGDRTRLEELLGDEGVRLPVHAYMNLPPVTSATVPVMYDDRSLA